MWQDTGIACDVAHAPRDAEVNPKFAPAATRLAMNYRFNEDDAAGHEEWSQGIFTPRRGERLWTLGVLSQYAAEVQPVVVWVVNEIGPFVYDRQVGARYIGATALWEGIGHHDTGWREPWWKSWQRGTPPSPFCNANVMTSG